MSGLSNVLGNFKKRRYFCSYLKVYHSQQPHKLKIRPYSYFFHCFSSKRLQNRKLVSNKTKGVQSYGCQDNHNHISFELQRCIYCSSIQVHVSLGSSYKFKVFIIYSSIIQIKKVMTGIWNRNWNAHGTPITAEGWGNGNCWSTWWPRGRLLPAPSIQHAFNTMTAPAIYGDVSSTHR